jgi:hypothetical protein
MQQRYASYFLNLVVVKTASDDAKRPNTPTYKISATTNQGVQIETKVPV